MNKKLNKIIRKEIQKILIYYKKFKQSIFKKNQKITNLFLILLLLSQMAVR